MSERSVLYVFDESATVRRSWSNLQRLVICPVTADASAIDSVLGSVDEETVTSTEVIDYGAHFNRKAFAIRDNYVEFLADFAAKPIFNGLNLKQYLTVSGGLSLWWLSSIAEKNTTASPAFARLAALLGILEIQSEVGCDEIWVDIRDRHLSRALVANAAITAASVKDKRAVSDDAPLFSSFKALEQALTSILRQATKAASARGSFGRRRANQLLRRSKYLLVTYFPLMNKQVWQSEKKFSDRYFGLLQEELENKQPDNLVWLAMFAKLEGVSWLGALRVARQARKRGYPILFVEQWLRFSDLVAIFYQATRLIFRRRQAWPVLERNFVFDDSGAKVNIWALFEPDWQDSFGGPGFIKAFAQYHMFSNIVKNAGEDASLLYMLEMLAWEKGLNMAADRREDLTTVGIQHTTVPLLLTNFAVDRSEWTGDYGIDAIPAPRWLACGGEITRDLMIKSGWPADRVFAWGAVRFGRFRELLNKKYEWDQRDRSVILALSYSPEESLELLASAVQAFSDSELQIVIKAHPNCPVPVLLDALGIELDHRRFTVSDRTLDELLPSARAMVVGGSSAVFDGLACGCPVVIPRLTRSVDTNPLSGVCDLQTYAKDPVDLREKVEGIVNAAVAPVSVEESQGFVRRYFRLPDSSGQLLTELEAKIGVQTVSA